MKKLGMILLVLSLNAYAFNDGTLPALTPQGEPGQKTGDIIQPVTTQQVATWCDFTKQIVNTNRGTFICSFNGWQPSSGA